MNKPNLLPSLGRFSRSLTVKLCVLAVIFLALPVVVTGVKLVTHHWSLAMGYFALEATGFQSMALTLMSPSPAAPIVSSSCSCPMSLSRAAWTFQDRKRIFAPAGSV